MGDWTSCDNLLLGLSALGLWGADLTVGKGVPGSSKIEVCWARF